MANKLK